MRDRSSVGNGVRGKWSDSGAPGDADGLARYAYLGDGSDINCKQRPLDDGSAPSPRECEVERERKCLKTVCVCGEGLSRNLPQHKYLFCPRICGATSSRCSFSRSSGGSGSGRGTSVNFRFPGADDDPLLPSHSLALFLSLCLYLSLSPLSQPSLTSLHPQRAGYSFLPSYTPHTGLPTLRESNQEGAPVHTRQTWQPETGFRTVSGGKFEHFIP